MRWQRWLGTAATLGLMAGFSLGARANEPSIAAQNPAELVTVSLGAPTGMIVVPEAQTWPPAALPAAAETAPAPRATAPVVEAPAAAPKVDEMGALDVPTPTVDLAAPYVIPALPEIAPVVMAVVEAEQAALARAAFAGAVARHIETGLTNAVRPRWLPEREQQALVMFYAQRAHQPLWLDDQGFNTRAANALAQLSRAAEDGLRPGDYEVPAPRDQDAASFAASEIALSLAALRYARDARGARLEPRRLSALITPTLSLPGAADLMARLHGEEAPSAVLASYQPPHEAYRALRDKLAAVRAALPPRAEAEPVIPHGPAVRVGMRDPRVELVRVRLGVSGQGAPLYDRSLSTVVAEFQRGNGLPVNGVLNRATIAALNGEAKPGLIGDLIAQMERWRWLPPDLGDEHLIVNVPEFMVRKVEDGAVVHEARVVVGKTERPTPIFSDMMDHLVINPSWTVPPTILREDFLPKLAADPGYAERRGLEVIRRGNQITLRQPPGPTNALGNIKFMFPNDHAVYLHDTPNRSLFNASRRAHSSGCVRVERPLKLAELVLGGRQSGWSEDRLRGMVGSGERTIRLTRRLPIHLVYMTHVVGADGRLSTFEDLYGFHRRTREALGL